MTQNPPSEQKGLGIPGPNFEDPCLSLRAAYTDRESFRTECYVTCLLTLFGLVRLLMARNGVTAGPAACPNSVAPSNGSMQHQCSATSVYISDSPSYHRRISSFYSTSESDNGSILDRTLDS